MADILKRNKALSVNPLKASQPIGGSLATLGFNRVNADAARLARLHRFCQSIFCTPFQGTHSFAKHGDGSGQFGDGRGRKCARRH